MCDVEVHVASPNASNPSLHASSHSCRCSKAARQNEARAGQQRRGADMLAGCAVREGLAWLLSLVARWLLACFVACCLSSSSCRPSLSLHVLPCSRLYGTTGIADATIGTTQAREIWSKCMYCRSPRGPRPPRVSARPRETCRASDPGALHLALVSTPRSENGTLEPHWRSFTPAALPRPVPVPTLDCLLCP